MRMSLQIDIDEMDYAELIAALLPHIDLNSLPIPVPDAVKQASGQSYASSILGNFLRFIPKEKQDEFVLTMFDKNRENIIKAAEKLAEKHDVHIKLSDITLTDRDNIII